METRAQLLKNEKQLSDTQFAQMQEEEDEVTAEQKSVVFTVRWCSETRGLTSTGYRIRFREQFYNIESIDPMNYGKKILKIHCRLERSQPDEQNCQHR